MACVYLVLYRIIRPGGGSGVSEHGAAIEAPTAEKALAILRRDYSATSITLTVHSVVDWRPSLMTKVLK